MQKRPITFSLEELGNSCLGTKCCPNSPVTPPAAIHSPAQSQELPQPPAAAGARWAWGHASSSSSARLGPELRVAAAFATAETQIPVYDHGSHANSFWKRPSWGFKTYLKKASSARARRQVTTRQLPHINIIKKLRASVCMAAYFRQPK